MESLQRKRRKLGSSSQVCAGCFDAPLPGKKFCKSCFGLLLQDTPVSEIPSGQGASVSREESDSSDFSGEESLEPMSELFSEEEEEETESSSFDLTLIPPLIKAIKLILGVEEEADAQKSKVLPSSSKPKQFFPLFPEVAELISAEWGKAAKKVSFASMTTRFAKLYPFKEQDTKNWDTAPAVDSPVIHLAKKTILPIDDSSVLRDPMDKRVETELRKAYQVAGASCKPAVALVSVAKAVSLWIDSLDKAIAEGTDTADISAGLSELKMAVAFMSEAAVDLTRLASRSMAVSVSARRALWLRSWGADAASKLSLCNLPYVGENLFGPKLQEVIEKATGGKSTFLPQERKKLKAQPFKGFFFRGSGRARGYASNYRYFGRGSSRQSSWRGGHSAVIRGNRIKLSPTSKKSS
ncbi:uncharacterized protein LOC121393812 [Xenopus laevis]|uniref:Uncharacterized protein LOC121393812 n=1 Tax=Xenopus laevis TaxID=8355 RepID=A0A8J1KPT4_XENLA|nr:uncharacterized protein LOC121393812 [Xenopus laevis]XP_041419327.1 uncharacterized protein LOC121393812 [Xenopus laevis]